MRCKTDLAQFLSEIAKYPLLTAERECELAPHARAGEQWAVDELVCHNLRLVVTSAKRYSSDVEMDDLIQAGVMGLYRATKDFDPDLARFCTHATNWIRQRQSELVRKRFLVHVPLYLQEGAKRADQGKPLLRNRYKKLEQAIKVIKADCSRHETSKCLDDGRWKDAAALLPDDPIQSPMEVAEQEVVRRRLYDQMLASLPESQRRVVHLRTTTDMTLQQIGATFRPKVTREWVSQLQKAAHAALKRRFADVDKELVLG